MVLSVGGAAGAAAEASVVAAGLVGAAGAGAPLASVELLPLRAASATTATREPPAISAVLSADNGAAQVRKKRQQCMVGSLWCRGQRCDQLRSGNLTA